MVPRQCLVHFLAAMLALAMWPGVGAQGNGSTEGNGSAEYTLLNVFETCVEFGLTDITTQEECFGEAKNEFFPTHTTKTPKYDLGVNGCVLDLLGDVLVFDNVSQSEEAAPARSYRYICRGLITTATTTEVSTTVTQTTTTCPTATCPAITCPQPFLLPAIGLAALCVALALGWLLDRLLCRPRAPRPAPRPARQEKGTQAQVYEPQPQPPPSRQLPPPVPPPIGVQLPPPPAELPVVTPPPPRPRCIDFCTIRRCLCPCHPWVSIKVGFVVESLKYTRLTHEAVAVVELEFEECIKDIWKDMAKTVEVDKFIGEVGPGVLERRWHWPDATDMDVALKEGNLIAEASSLGIGQPFSAWSLGLAIDSGRPVHQVHRLAGPASPGDRVTRSVSCPDHQLQASRPAPQVHQLPGPTSPGERVTLLASDVRAQAARMIVDRMYSTLTREQMDGIKGGVKKLISSMAEVDPSVVKVQLEEGDVFVETTIRLREYMSLGFQEVLRNPDAVSMASKIKGVRGIERVLKDGRARDDIKVKDLTWLSPL